MLSNLVPKIMGWLVVVITLALAPTINTYNTAVTTNVSAATNAAKMIGMTAVDDFGGFLIIMGLLITGGLFGVAGVRNKLGGASIRDMLEIIGAVIITVIALAMFSGSVIGYIDALIDASSGFAQTAYGILAIILYVAIIAGATGFAALKYKRARKGSSRRKSSRAFI